MSGEKRSQERDDTLHEETVIIVDIEGTTTSISFVKDTLFPYVRDNLKQYIEKNWEVEEFKGDLEKLKEQAKKDETDKVEGDVLITGATPEEEKESVIKNVLWQMDGDRKTGALKQLQGHMWREAYESGAIKGHVYEDVPKAFDEWIKSGRKIYVYSSGSVEAQKLLFGKSEHGDMLKYFSGHFDTEVGPKQEASSYKNILAKIEAEPSNVLFLTDIVKEGEAAKEAGLSVNILIRPGNAPLTDEEKVKFSTIDSFMDLSFQTSAKRQKVEKTEAEAKPVQPEASEPMDTSEDNVDSKIGEKSEESKKVAESAKIEEPKLSEKSETSSMETDSKVETEKSAIVDKTVEIAEAPKSEKESKIELAKETPASEVSKKEIDVAKKEIDVAKKDTDVAKKEIDVAKKETDVAKKEIDVAKKVSETTKTEPEKVASEPIDEPKIDLPSKSEPTVKITEEKTELNKKVLESVESESKSVTDKVSVSETASEEKSKLTAEESSVTEKIPIVETKVEEKVEDKKSAVTEEKIEPVLPDTIDKAPSKVEKPAAEKPKQNGDNEPSKSAEDSASKAESNGDAKVVEAAKEVETVIEKKSAPVTEEPEKKPETNVEPPKKENENEKSKIAETGADETSDSKLNGTAQNGEKASTDEKPHRNGLNGESSTEKSNGNKSQNGEAETSTEATTDSIKVKKVVDSTVADGAGEPEVVPPVAVAATS